MHTMARRSLIRVIGFRRVHKNTRARSPMLVKAWVMLGSRSLQSHSNPSAKRHRGTWRKKVTEDEILSWTPVPDICPFSGCARRSSGFSSSFDSFASSPDSSSRAGWFIAIWAAIWGSIIMSGFIIICCWTFCRLAAGMAKTNDHKRDGITEATSEIAAHQSHMSTSVQWFSIFFLEFYISSLAFERFWENLRKFWEIFRKFWEILRNFEKFWPDLAILL